jgi:D-alanyl-D-alanine dipeptidase
MHPFKFLLFLLLSTNAFSKALPLVNPFGPDYVDLSAIPNLTVDLRYATARNFTRQKVYAVLTHAYLQKIAYAKLLKASECLKEKKPKWKFIVFDALRPRSAQRRLYAVVKGTPEAQYVMDPDKGSFHNYGFAVDIGLVDESGHEIDMGTGFDNFTTVAQPKFETINHDAGKLSSMAIEHRHLLRDCMESGGFKQLPIEWWHFDAVPRAELAKYPIVE